MKYSFSGINIYSREPEKTFLFYQTLGLRVVRKADSDDPWYGSTLALSECHDEPVIWIWRLGEQDTTDTCNHLVFSANGKHDEIYRSLRDSGITCEPPFVAPWGGIEFIVRDPDGNEILFL